MSLWSLGLIIIYLIITYIWSLDLTIIYISDYILLIFSFWASPGRFLDKKWILPSTVIRMLTSFSLISASNGSTCVNQNLVTAWTNGRFPKIWQIMVKLEAKTKHIFEGVLTSSIITPFSSLSRIWNQRNILMFVKLCF